ncbi:MAG: phosphoenolpyruvate carboxykinase (ATP) [Christensenellaceae bacterium]|jgi:phosphoenolpyruvate carboxykinase (ATP)|nr:phosphoenolpyruvate carboxykinase (ATP) [Christensenellaceae bacterium]
MAELNLEYLGILNPAAVHHNMPVPALVERALDRGEGILSKTGALVVKTGKYTGRSPEDRYVIDAPSVHDEIDWGSVNRPMSQENYDLIYNRMMAYLQNRELFVFDGYANADKAYQKKIRVVNEFAYENLFIHQLLLRPESDAEIENFAPDFTIIAAPGFQCVPELDNTHSEAAILVNFPKKQVIIAGTKYAGEIKKSVFGIMNYLLPSQDVFPMHCSANTGKDGDVALFFGLSGTGKTTLSADPNRYLIGDDEHGWHKNGSFNMEGGCYAKCINLSKENEPEIYAAIRFGALVENVVMDENTREFDFADESITENTRVGYPVEFISNTVIPGVGGVPKTVVFLTADAFGVLPPVAKLTREQAMFHYVSGYTARLAGTERGVTEPQATFSTCFGAPFLPRAAKVYAELLGKRLDESGASVYLINTGWSGGSAGKGGARMKLPYTRAMVTAALNGELDKGEFVTDEIFGVSVPTACPGVPTEVLAPKNVWKDKAAYDKIARELAASFRKNFAKYDMPEAVVKAGPQG